MSGVTWDRTTEDDIADLRAQLTAETARANAAEESLRQHVWECKNELTHRINADLKTAIVKAERAAFDPRTALTQVTRERDEARTRLRDRCLSEIDEWEKSELSRITLCEQLTAADALLEQIEWWFKMNPMAPEEEHVCSDISLLDALAAYRKLRGK